MTARPGRPRASAERDTRRDVLAAAAALFATVGYTATSTYAIAERAGVKQASIYHHFRGKDVLLRTLLVEALRPSLDLAERLVAQPGPAAARLWALCDTDARWLADGPVNVGAMLHLPEVEDAAFAEFHAERARLRDAYGALVAAVLAERSGSGADVDGDVAPDAAGGLVFGLVEAVVTARRTDGVAAASRVAPLVADAALRMLGLDAPSVRAARAAADVLVPHPRGPEDGDLGPAAVDVQATAAARDVG